MSKKSRKKKQFNNAAQETVVSTRQPINEPVPHKDNPPTTDPAANRGESLETDTMNVILMREYGIFADNVITGSTENKGKEQVPVQNIPPATADPAANGTKPEAHANEKDHIPDVEEDEKEDARDKETPSVPSPKNTEEPCQEANGAVPDDDLMDKFEAWSSGETAPEDSSEKEPQQKDEAVQPEISASQMKKDLTRKTAINTFMQNYTVTDASARTVRGKKKAELSEVKRSEEESRESSGRVIPSHYDDEDDEKPHKLLRVAAIISALVIVFMVSNYFFDFVSFKNEKADTETIMLNYQSIAEAAFEQDITFNDMSWRTSNEALSYATNLLNEFLGSSQTITYDGEESFATAGLDGWGRPMYVTALQQKSDRETYKYDFYLISAGEDGNFDEVNLRLDADDVYTVLYSMPKASKTINSVAGFENFEINEQEKSGPSIPIAFDQQGGEGGTTIVQAEIGSILPSIQPPTKEGFTFVGYYDSPVNGTMYYNESGIGYYICKSNQGMTLYARWASAAPDDGNKEKQITITVQHFAENDNGGFPSKPSKTTTISRQSGKVNLLNLADESILETGKTVYSTQIDNEDADMVTINKDTTVKIYYAAAQHTVTVTKGRGIALVAGAGQHTTGETVTLTATATEGYVFAMWSGDFTGNSQSITFTMPARNVKIQALANLEGAVVEEHQPEHETKKAPAEEVATPEPETTGDNT